MNLSESELLGKLGDGESIESVCATAGISRAEFDQWWTEATARRVPVSEGRFVAGTSGEVTIARDRLGIPHILAENDADLFFGYGWAMAEDRLFQLDWLRRKGRGRLAEIIGTDGVPFDTIARTVGLNRIAEGEWSTLPENVQATLESFAAGINAMMEASADNLPIEFDLLRYRPEPWTPIDSLAIEVEFRWYLTGRFPIICIPELAGRTLGEGPAWQQFLLGECDAESILHPGDYSPAASRPLESVGHVANDPDAAIGSNNWVISGKRTTTGAPLIGSDPHIAFEAVSCWYEAHLCGGSFNVAGMTYVGMPAIMFGRNENVAWGITNNISSLRDLYQEQTDADRPACFLFDGTWEPAREISETIHVRDADPIEKTIRITRNGPIVDGILPPPADRTGPVSLNWLGLHQGGWLTALLDMNRAGNVAELREAMRPWHVPTFSLVLADVEGRIGFQSSGRIPVRKREERGYRNGWDPEDQWQGLVPFEEMPGTDEPERGWIATANNRLAPDDYPHLLFGRWSCGWRGQRIREMIESREKLSTDDIREMHQDAESLRARTVMPSLLQILGDGGDAKEAEAIRVLGVWDHCSLPDATGATIFNVFFTRWCRTVADQHFEPAAAELLAAGIAGCAAHLLTCDAGEASIWFADGSRDDRVRKTFSETIAGLGDRFGTDLTDWTWSRLHRMPLRHVLSPRGDLGQLLDHGGAAVRGDMMTVCNTGSGPDWIAATGAGYRMIADLSTSPASLRAVDAQSQSGHPGSGHYSDQFEDWVSGRYHEIPLDRESALAAAARTLTLTTAGS